MRRFKAQSLVDFVVLSAVVVSIIIFGLYQFSGSLSDFFQGNSPDKKFNKSRTVRYEKPNDIISNVTVTISGVTISPPVESVLSLSPIATSGSAGRAVDRVLENGKIAEAYATELKKIIQIGPNPDVVAKNKFKNSLNNLASDLSVITTSGTTGLEQILDLMDMVFELADSSSNIQTKANNYLATLPDGLKKDIVESFVNDLLSVGSFIEYDIDSSIYPTLIGEEKNNSIAQDKSIISELHTQITSMSDEQKQYYAAKINMNINNSYSALSPEAYNGIKMCNSFGGNIEDNTCKLSF